MGQTSREKVIEGIVAAMSELAASTHNTPVKNALSAMDSILSNRSSPDHTLVSETTLTPHFPLGVRAGYRIDLEITNGICFVESAALFSLTKSIISDARVYGGIHFRTDQDAGALLGTRIGDYIYNHKLRPDQGGNSDDR